MLIAAGSAALLANVAQVGLHFAPQALRPSFARLHLGRGLKRLVSPNQLVELGKTLAKVGIVGAVAFQAVRGRLATIGELVGAPPATILSTGARMVLQIGLRVGTAMAVVAALDFAWQRLRHERSLRMTKEELKQEVREQDVTPELRSQIRRRQSEQARRRMMTAVPSADVVIVNPTHYAVALRYDGSRPAPEVVAKGRDLVALAIRRVAEEAQVTVVHEPPLARALYASVELGQTIPEEFYAAVAEILAFVYRVAGRRRRAISA